MVSSTTFPIDYQGLIYSNCLMIFGDHCDIDITSQVADSKWTVHVLKTEKRKRTAVFSESSSTLSGALEALHEKSAMAVNQFITTNGFDLPPKFSSRSAGRKASRGTYRTSLDESEIISLDGESGTSSSSDESEDGSSDSDVSRSVSSGGKGARRAIARITPRPYMAVRRSEPYGNGPPYRATYEHHPFDAVGRPPHGPFLPPVGPGLARPARICKQSPPPAPGNMQGIPPPPGRIPHSLRSSPAYGHGVPPPPPRHLGVLMSISWIGHGEINILDDSLLSVPILRTRVSQLVRQRVAEFQDTASVNLSMTLLQVAIKRLHIGSKSYEIGNFMGNLYAVFESSPEFPRIEVEVRSMPMPPAPNEAATHVQSHKSD